MTRCFSVPPAGFEPATPALTDTTVLLGPDAVSVARVERLADGTRRVHLVTVDEQARACPECGVFATRVEGLRDDPAPGSAVRREGTGVPPAQRRWWCREPGCPRRSFTEQIPQLPAGARITMRLRGAAGRRIHDAASTVIQAAGDLHLSWPTVMDAFRAAAREVIEAPPPEVRVLGIDETRRGRRCWGQGPRRGQVDSDARSVAHRVRRCTRCRRPARPGRGPHRRRCARLARHHPADLEEEHRVRGHRHVGHLPCRRPHRSPARHRRSSPATSSRGCDSLAQGSPTPFTTGIRSAPPVQEGPGFNEGSVQDDQAQGVLGAGGSHRSAELPGAPVLLGEEPADPHPRVRADLADDMS